MKEEAVCSIQSVCSIRLLICKSAAVDDIPASLRATLLPMTVATADAVKWLLWLWKDFPKWRRMLKLFPTCCSAWQSTHKEESMSMSFCMDLYVYTLGWDTAYVHRAWISFTSLVVHRKGTITLIVLLVPSLSNSLWITCEVPCLTEPFPSSLLQ